MMLHRSVNRKEEDFKLCSRSLGDVNCSLGDANCSLGDVNFSLGGANCSLSEYISDDKLFYVFDVLL